MSVPSSNISIMWFYQASGCDSRIIRTCHLPARHGDHIESAHSRLCARCDHLSRVRRARSATVADVDGLSEELGHPTARSRRAADPGHESGGVCTTPAERVYTISSSALASSAARSLTRRIIASRLRRPTPGLFRRTAPVYRPRAIVGGFQPLSERRSARLSKSLSILVRADAETISVRARALARHRGSAVGEVD